MRVKVLGSAAGGGFPQWNCGCSNCSRLRGGVLKGRARTQTQVAVSPSALVSLGPANPNSSDSISVHSGSLDSKSANSGWILLNASPDLRQQILSDAAFAPNTSRGTPIHAIVLTSADTDSVLGLLHLREFQPLRIYATEGVRRVITEENSLFRVLGRSVPPVRWETLPLDRPTPLLEGAGPEGGLCLRAVSVHGEFPDYVSESLRGSLRREEAVIALELTQCEKKLFFAPTLPGHGDEWKRHVAESQLALLDGTFWTDNELIDVRGAGKTAREIGHMPLSGPNGLLEQLRHVRAARRVLVHLNNTNPVLDEESAAHRTLREAGWEVAHDGMEFHL